MKQSGNKQYQRKTQSLLASLMFRLSQGPVENSPFAAAIQQMLSDRIKANPVDTDVLKNSLAQAKLNRLPKTKRLKQKFTRYMRLQQEKEKDGEQFSGNSSLTLGQIVNGWAGLTGQNETEFASKVCPKIKKLLIEQYKVTGHLGFTDSQAYENPASAFNFTTDLFNILIEETPEDKKNSLIEQMKAILIVSSTQSVVEVDNELLHDASTMLTAETVTQINEALSRNPSAKDRLVHPLFGELMVMEAKKYGWDSGVPEDNHAQLQSELSQNGVSPSKRMMARSLKRLGRKNILQNVNDALDGNLVEKLNSIISEQTTIEQNKIQTVWEFSPVSPGATAEIEKSVREWIFRRNNK